MINFIDNVEIATPIFNKAAEAIRVHKISPNPLNYFLCYEYFKGDIPDFVVAMSPYVEGTTPLLERTSKQLYQTYFEDDELLAKFENALRSLFKNIMDKLTNWGESINSEMQTMQQYEPELKKLTPELLSSIQRIQINSQDVIKEVLETKKELEALHKELAHAKQQAYIDELTNIGNRRAFYDKVRETLSITADSGKDHVMVMADIDHFKSFNDTYGHLIGDSVLRVFAKLAHEECQKHKLCDIYRYGGEEFIMVMQNTTLDKAEEIANTIRLLLQKTRLKPKNSEKPLKTITASFGISRRVNDDSIDAWLERTDTALYFAKHSGRNQVIVQNIE